jgi:hypothetical protein
VPSGGGLISIVPAPATGYAIVCGTLTLATSLSATKQATIQGASTMDVYLNFQVPPLASVVAPWIFDLELVTNEGLVGGVQAGDAGGVQFTIAYTVQPLSV